MSATDVATVTTAARLRRAGYSFTVPAFRRVWAGAVLFALGQWMERVAIGWFVLDLTGSVFLTAAAWAVRIAPSTLLGPIAGAASDRFPRGAILAAASVLRVLVLMVVALLVLAGRESVGVLLLLVAVSGVAIPFTITSLQALAADVVGQERLANAVSLTAFGQRAVGAGGALLGGMLIAAVGPGVAFLLAGVPFLGAAYAFAGVRARRTAPIGTRRSFSAEVGEGLRLIVEMPLVALLLAITIAVEILGFSYNSLLPVVAERVLDVGSDGLGALTGATAVGSMLGMALLAALSDIPRRGPLMIGVILVFGILLLALGTSTVFVVSLVILVGVGGVAAMVDALQWIILQSAVPDRLRGRALGIWNLAIGFGWIGPLLLGAAADLVGVRWAFLMAGGLLLALGAVAALFAKPLSER